MLHGDTSIDEAQIARMCACIEHRGPDDSAVHLHERIGLGMQRLSIIDVEGGNQPIFNEDGSVRTVYNGEIYNFRELRAELEGRGHRFATAADTEVIVHGWEEWGIGFTERLNGMFALALHDCASTAVRSGARPDRYQASLLRPARRLPGVRIGDQDAASLRLGRSRAQHRRRQPVSRLGVRPGNEHAPQRRVHKLEPGALLDVDLETAASGSATPQPRVWWDLPPNEAWTRPSGPRSAAEWEDAIDAKLRECVRRRLVADVPLGAFLSGGVDSSLLVAGMGEARTFSIGFDDPSYNELAWARKVADHLGVDHQDEIIRPDVVELFDHLMNFMDDPIADFSIFPTYLVSRLARRHVKVVLSGDGGDELFGGYETYVAQRMARQLVANPRSAAQWPAAPGDPGAETTPRKEGPRQHGTALRRGVRSRRGSRPRPLAACSPARWPCRGLLSDDARAECSTPTSEHIVELARRAGDRRRPRQGPLRRPQELPVRQHSRQSGPHVDGLLPRGSRSLPRPRARRARLSGCLPSSRSRNATPR